MNKNALSGQNSRITIKFNQWSKIEVRKRKNYEDGVSENFQLEKGVYLVNRKYLMMMGTQNVSEFNCFKEPWFQAIPKKMIFLTLVDGSKRDSFSYQGEF